MTRGPILERESELAQLDDLVAGLSAGAGHTLLIEGAPGLGKSRLLAEARARVGCASGIRVLSFACGELEQELAWAGVLGLLSPTIDGLEPDERAALFTGAAAPAARVFDAPFSAGAGQPELDRYGAAHALFRLVGVLARRRPLLLLYDDAHWSDRDSLTFLLYLQRRLAELPVGLVVASRPPAMVPAPDLLEQLAAGPETTVRALAPLALDSVSVLVHAQGFPEAAESFCHGCWQITAGNPFYLHELLLSLHADDVADPGSADLAEIPPRSILRSVLIRLGRIAVPYAAALAQAVAVLGDGATLRTAARLAGIDLAAAGDAADALARAELLAAGEPLRFAHPLVRAAIYADIPAARRAREHARAAELMAAEELSSEHVALHLLHAPLTASPAVVSTLRDAAARAVQRGAPQAALTFLRRAQQEPPAPDQRLPVLLDMAGAETALGDPAAIAHMREALDLVGEDGRRRAELLLDLGWAEHRAGRFGDAAATLEAGMALVPADSDLAAQLEAGYLMSASLDVSRVAGALERIAVIEASPGRWRGLAERELLAQVLYLRTVSTASAQDNIALARRLWDGGRLLAETGPDWSSLWHIVGALSWADALSDSVAAVEQVLAVADARGSALPRAWGGYARAWPHYWMGRLDAAVADARMAVEIWAGGMETYLPAALYWLGRAELQRGRPQAAREALALAGPEQRWEGTGMLGFLYGLRGHLAAADGDSATAVAMHEACGAQLAQLMVTNPSVMAWRSEAALSLRLLGDVDRARALIATELELARGFGAPRAIGNALWALGICEGPDGERHLREAVTVLAGSEADLEHARALIELGAAIRRGGRRRAARPYLERARELLEGSGAVVLLDRAQTELRAAGGRAPRGERSGVEALTASERRVAELAADGHSNRHIAGLLQISIKAVEWHLHQCYLKLDIRGRRQLAGQLGD